MKGFIVRAGLCAGALLVTASAIFFSASGKHHKSESLLPDAGQSSAQASVTVSFGGWMANPHLCPPPVNTSPPVPCPIVDRFANNAATQFPFRSNHHVIIPQIATIKAGGYVNFIISGFHVVTVYDDGTQPNDIDPSILVPGPRPGPPIINDATNRIYRGLDPLVLPEKSAPDRVEVVQFDDPGTYLVICSVLPHFQEGMYGYIRVLSANKDIAN